MTTFKSILTFTECNEILATSYKYYPNSFLINMTCNKINTVSVSPDYASSVRSFATKSKFLSFNQRKVSTKQKFQILRLPKKAV